MDLQAVRSLMCEDHAHNLPPRVKSISWFLGKRCNYDCSYCSPHVHDAVSPFVDRSVALDFIHRVHDYGIQKSYQFHWHFTGGEPFLDPSFIDMLEQLSRSPTTYQINSTTNGSLPVEIYQRAAKISKGITFSLHLERSQKEISDTMSKILQIFSDGDTYVNVNVMLLQGQLQQVKSIVQELQHHGVAYVVRKISPPAPLEDQAPYCKIGMGKKDRVLLDMHQQVQHKMIWLDRNNKAKFQNTNDYYSTEEHDFLADINQSISWNNMGVWDKDNYREINSEILVSRQINSFPGWICYAGVDHINIDFDGSIYRAQCQNLGPIGNIDHADIFADTPTVCQVNWCSCNLDIPIRKARNNQSLRLIDG